MDQTDVVRSIFVTGPAAGAVIVTVMVFLKFLSAERTARQKWYEIDRDRQVIHDKEDKEFRLQLLGRIELMQSTMIGAVRENNSVLGSIGELLRRTNGVLEHFEEKLRDEK